MHVTITPEPNEHLHDRDLAEVMKSLRSKLREAGVGTGHVEGGVDSPWPAVRERLGDVGRAVDEQAARLVADVERLFLNREA